MNAITRHSLTKATVTAGLSVMEKSAAATPEQAEVLSAAWPDGSEQTKTASLAKMLAAGMLVEEAEASAG
jgi:hypothetical protein